MNNIYQHILLKSQQKQRQLAVLIDPDKIQLDDIEGFLSKVNQLAVTLILVGGSEVRKNYTEKVVTEVKRYTKIPVVLFPGEESQLTAKADALLFLSLISGRNPDYLIGKHVQVAESLSKLHLEVIPTGYILIENGKMTSVERVSLTKPIARDQVKTIVNTAKAGEYLGMKLIYLEAGSGALHPVSTEIIDAVKTKINLPLIVGGGIRSKALMNAAYEAGADMVVIGTAFERDDALFKELI